MESQNYLGIYFSKDTATVACVDLQGRDENIIGSFSITTADSEQPSINHLANLIAQGCSERKFKFSAVAVALDCAIFMQHGVHSEFTDVKQISTTIKFDAEEALGTDITEVALAFEIASTDQTGSNLNVYTAQRKILSEILLSLQQYNFDPITIEPDVKSLSRFLGRKIQPDESGQKILFSMLSSRTGYLIAPPVKEDSLKTPIVRTFLIGPKQNRTQLLQRELLVTTALSSNQISIKKLKVFDSSGTIDSEILRQRLTLETSGIDFFDSAAPDSVNPIDLAIACGAAVSLAYKEQAVNFRDDFSPFQGKKVRMQKTLKFTAVSVTILLIAIGLYFQLQLFMKGKDIKNLTNSLTQEYAAVTQRTIDGNLTVTEVVNRLGSLKRQIEKENQGIITDDTSVSSKLTLLLEAFNKCAADTKLNIKTIVISMNDIVITGNVSNRQKRAVFFATLRDSGLEIVREDYDSEGGIEHFSITVEPENIQEGMI
ncbi:hypothetical protein ACFLZ8_02625 [Planctomycetota bacterium]